ELNKEVVLRIDFRGAHGTLEIKRQPLLNAFAGQFRTALGEIEKQHQVENEWGGAYGIAAEKINLDLHGIAQPPEDVQVVPAFLVIATRRVVIDSHFVAEIAVMLRVQFRLQDVSEL